MDAERCLHGYIFVPYCTEYCCQIEPQSIQQCQDFYPCSFPKQDSISAELSRSNRTYSPRFNDHEEANYRWLISAIEREPPPPCELSRHNIRSESDVPETLKEGYFDTQKKWKLRAICKGKRNRTIFTADQLERLEKEFQRQQYIVGAQRFYLASDLGLNETQVKVWFQNRRIKWRRQNLESATASLRESKFEPDENEGK